MLIFQNRYWRQQQGSNLRGGTPIDFKSIALTTRPYWRPVLLIQKVLYKYTTFWVLYLFYSILDHALMLIKVIINPFFDNKNLRLMLPY